MSDKNGGPAFPVQEPLEKYDSERGRYVTVYQPTGGMSLRDYFAGQVLAGYGARDSFDHGLATPEQRARLAYIDADAMIAEREKQS